jgi:hypothetical protein
VGTRARVASARETCLLRLVCDLAGALTRGVTAQHVQQPLCDVRPKRAARGSQGLLSVRAQHA